MNNTKSAHEVQQGILRAEQEGQEEKATGVQPLIHASIVYSDQTGSPQWFKLRNLDMQAQGLSEAT